MDDMASFVSLSFVERANRILTDRLQSTVDIVGWTLELRTLCIGVAADGRDTLSGATRRFDYPPILDCPRDS